MPMGIIGDEAWAERGVEVTPPRPCGCRFKSLQQRALIEPRRKIEQKKQGKKVEYIHVSCDGGEEDCLLLGCRGRRQLAVPLRIRAFCPPQGERADKAAERQAELRELRQARSKQQQQAKKTARAAQRALELF